MTRRYTDEYARLLKCPNNDTRTDLDDEAALRQRQQVIPTLRITDYRLSKAFYTVLLGFRVDWEHCYDPETAVFMQISRAGMLIFLTQHEGDCQVGGLVHFFVPDVDAFHAELCRRGTPIKQAPRMGIEGYRMMTLVDPDGNQLRICARSKK
jgi:predicted enzyme related to lactoylglutathione lyase